MDAAEILSREALTIESLIRAGWEPDSARDAVTSGDFSRLQHTGLYSVQLQPPGAGAPAPAREAVVVTEPRSQDVHIHLPESTEIELRQDRVVDMLEQFGNAIQGIEARTAMVDERMANAPTPIINVAAPHVTVNVPETPVQLSLDMPTPVINVASPEVIVMPNQEGPHRKSVKFNKDEAGNITGATVIEE